MERARYLASFAVAGVVTFGLFWLMQALIGVEGKLDESKKGKVIDFVRLKRDSDTETKDRELPDRKPPEKEPPPPDLNLSQNLRPDAGEWERRPPRTRRGVAPDPVGFRARGSPWSPTADKPAAAVDRFASSRRSGRRRLRRFGIAFRCRSP